MAEENGAAPQPAPQVRMQVLAQFIKDMSFENMVAQKGLTSTEVQPDVQVGVSLDARKRNADNQFDVTLKVKVTNRNKANGEALFLLELDYGGVFLVENVPEAQLHAYLLIECPRMIFPYVRRIVSDVTRDGGFPPLNMESIDFVALYRQELARRVQAQQAEAGAKAN